MTVREFFNLDYIEIASSRVELLGIVTPEFATSELMMNYGMDKDTINSLDNVVEEWKEQYQKDNKRLNNLITIPDYGLCVNFEFLYQSNYLFEFEVEKFILNDQFVNPVLLIRLDYTESSVE